MAFLMRFTGPETPCTWPYCTGIYTWQMKLPEKYRLPTLLHYLEGYSLKEIARILRIPESKVKSRLHQARGKLRDLLGGEDYEA